MRKSSRGKARPRAKSTARRARRTVRKAVKSTKKKLTSKSTRVKVKKALHKVPKTTARLAVKLENMSPEDISKHVMNEVKRFGKQRSQKVFEAAKAKVWKKAAERARHMKKFAMHAIDRTEKAMEKYEKIINVAAPVVTAGATVLPELVPVAGAMDTSAAWVASKKRLIDKTKEAVDKGDSRALGIPLISEEPMIKRLKKISQQTRPLMEEIHTPEVIDLPPPDDEGL